ncbi:unnamed protein product [Cuscuta epithymum]|uniref:Uncharacterized protein n=1 Tax=Cuscuta epithymum TaxID=186058 RepID=A0AAV0CHD0_9ASTE|nr:unnamed protein product [Cuscuta epithymum]
MTEMLKTEMNRDHGSESLDTVSHEFQVTFLCDSRRMVSLAIVRSSVAEVLLWREKKLGGNCLLHDVFIFYTLSLENE